MPFLRNLQNNILCTGNNKKDNLNPATINEEMVQRWLIRAKEGHVAAQYNLACAYYEGAGIHKDWNKAVHWFKAAGNQGNVDGLYMVGMMY